MRELAPRFQVKTGGVLVTGSVPSSSVRNWTEKKPPPPLRALCQPLARAARQRKTQATFRNAPQGEPRQNSESRAGSTKLLKARLRPGTWFSCCPNLHVATRRTGRRRASCPRNPIGAANPENSHAQPGACSHGIRRIMIEQRTSQVEAAQFARRETGRCHEADRPLGL